VQNSGNNVMMVVKGVHHHEIHSFPNSLLYSEQNNQEELQNSIQVPFGVDNAGGNIQRFVSFHNAF